MNLSDYYTTADTVEGFVFSREQGSRFAKEVAGDFNPLHDIDAKKFCVPGDLLFSLSLAKLGVSTKMRFDFSGMVSEDIHLHFAKQSDSATQILDAAGKEYLAIQREGEVSEQLEFATNLAERYVAFSGYTFPHVLVPLMADQNVMINPARPMVIYQSMSIDMLRLDVEDLTLEMTECTLDVQGKRGTALLKFCFKSQEEVIGYGEKTMILSGLREYDQSVIDELVNDYQTRKSAAQ